MCQHTTAVLPYQVHMPFFNRLFAIKCFLVSVDVIPYLHLDLRLAYVSHLMSHLIIMTLSYLGHGHGKVPEKSRINIHIIENVPGTHFYLWCLQPDQNEIGMKMGP